VIVIYQKKQIAVNTDRNTVVTAIENNKEVVLLKKKQLLSKCKRGFAQYEQPCQKYTTKVVLFGTR